MKWFSALLIVLNLFASASARNITMNVGDDAFVFDYNLSGKAIRVYEIGENEPYSDEMESLMHNWFAVEDIFKAVPGVQSEVSLGSTYGIGNAFAVIFNGKRYIVVDRSFHVNYALMTMVIAHEIGHHACGHTAGMMRDNPWERELEADTVAGTIIRSLEQDGSGYGINLQDSLSMAAQIFSVAGSSHPPRAARVAAIVNGYNFGSPCVGRKLVSLPHNGTSSEALPSGSPPLWEHNGSTIRLEANGTARNFYYISPRDGLVQRGVKQGTLLFTGTKSGNSYSGTAYTFSKCGPIPYQVSGPVSDNQRQVTMHGQAPRLDSNCRVVGYRTDTLLFSFSGD